MRLLGMGMASYGCACYGYGLIWVCVRVYMCVGRAHFLYEPVCCAGWRVLPKIDFQSLNESYELRSVYDQTVNMY